MHENLVAAGLEEFTEGIYGVLKMKQDHIPEEVLTHVDEKDLQDFTSCMGKEKKQNSSGSMAGEGGSSRSGHWSCSLVKSFTRQLYKESLEFNEEPQLFHGTEESKKNSWRRLVV